MLVEEDCLISDEGAGRMVKLLDNGHREVNITSTNEISLIADNLGINFCGLIELASYYTRVNNVYLTSGVGRR